MRHLFNNTKYILIIVLIILLAGSSIVYHLTISQMNTIPDSFKDIILQSHEPIIVDRYGHFLNTAYDNGWNKRDLVELHEIPEFIINSFIISEDKRFFKHEGIDWKARLASVYTNISNFNSLRGASTITEQVVRLINNRPRTIWSKWIEGWEARSLENNFSKSEILKFYLNQIPYASNRRGIVQASMYYFDRDLDTLTKKEMLALVILVRAPSRMDLYKDVEAVEKSISRLSEKLVEMGYLSREEYTSISSERLTTSRPFPNVSSPHFTEYIKSINTKQVISAKKIETTLDTHIQQTIRSLLDNTLSNLETKRVNNAAVLVADHVTGDILAWVVGSRYDQTVPGSFINAVTVPRQPGSALKPFLYALALEKGWMASTIIDDSPLTELVGNGLHSYQNYSRTFYGPVTLRQALANSLNIPAVRTLQFVGDIEYLNTLRKLKFDGLKNSPDFYGDGLSLGNGEVSLYQLVQAYCALANMGILVDLNPFIENYSRSRERVFSEESTSIIANILSDPEARTIEFGDNSVLNFPVQTAVKTGTSSDYRDAWAIGFNYKYTVGIWMGNLDQTPTDGLTGSTGPALVLRSIFNDLTKYEDTEPLYLSRKLIRHDICINKEVTDITDDNCLIKSEWYTKNTVPYKKKTTVSENKNIRLIKPVSGLHLAYNPRIPGSLQSFEFIVEGIENTDKVLWKIDRDTYETYGSTYEWNLKRGSHILSASVWRNGNKIANIEETPFLVK